MDDTRRSYDAVAAGYAAALSHELDGKPFDRGLLDAVVELAGGGLIADVGCGPGHVAAHLAARGARTVGVDLSPRMCAVAREAGVASAAASMTALPLASASLAAIACLYAVIHLDPAERELAYAEFTRVLRPGGHALVAFHVSDDDNAPGDVKILDRWFDRDVGLRFRFLEPDAEIGRLVGSGLRFVARLDRAPAGAEHPSMRSYLLVARPGGRAPDISRRL